MGVIQGGENLVDVVKGTISVQGIRDYLWPTVINEAFWFTKAGEDLNSDEKGYFLEYILGDAHATGQHVS